MAKSKNAKAIVRAIIKWAFLAAYVALFILILVEAATPGEGSAAQSTVITDVVIEVAHIDAPKGSPAYEEVHISVRKIVGHYSLFAFFALMGDGFLLLQWKKPWHIGLGALVSLTVGLFAAFFSEYLQTLVPARAGLPEDAWIDAGGYGTGLLIGAIVFLVLFLVRKKKEKDSACSSLSEDKR